MDLKICHVLISLEGNSATFTILTIMQQGEPEYQIPFQTRKKLWTIHYDKYEYIQVHIIQIHVLFF